ncbi:unnamed protein product [Cyclocybe aegerita]|uniref:Uncharacterized protein n=1 Tax=Cyclocybe aegerita TaxID=1973307 RepID=A0A8S0W1G1_CYCAE|nr:unnamed protein product [Cyclocybe aegerita]
MSALHPHWQRLIEWLAAQGMQTDKIRVVARTAPGAGYGLFALENLGPSTPLFTVPAHTLLNHLTLSPHYPAARPKLSCTQLVSLHLSLHRPLGEVSDDPLFGPYISVLPRDFDWHPFTWLWKTKTQRHDAPLETRLCESLPPRIVEKLDRTCALFKKDWRVIQKYLESHPAICPVQTGLRVDDFLWGWLNGLWLMFLVYKLALNVKLQEQ